MESSFLIFWFSFALFFLSLGNLSVYCSPFMFQNGQSSHILRIFDEEAQAVQSVRNSSRMLEEAYATGVAVLSKYSEQRDHLKVLDLKCMQNTNRCRSLNCVCYNNACQIQIHINVHIKL